MTVSKNLRDLVFERDSYTCVLCSKATTDAHHVVRRSHGGANHLHNLVALCRQHHDLIHGTIWHGIEMTTDEAEQTVFELSKKHPSGKTSTASKRKYNERVYTRIDFAIPKDLAAQFWVKCHMNNASMRSVIMDVMKLYLY